MEYIKGDIIQAFKDGDINVLMHQTNCTSRADVHGIAQTIFKEFPEALKAHLSFCQFGHYSATMIGITQHILNLNSQYYPGFPIGKTFTIPGLPYKLQDNFENRLIALETILKVLPFKPGSWEIGIPLIASGKGADQELKGEKSDLEYFQEFIAPVISKYITRVKVYHK